MRSAPCSRYMTLSYNLYINFQELLRQLNSKDLLHHNQCIEIICFKAVQFFFKYPQNFLTNKLRKDFFASFDQNTKNQVILRNFLHFPFAISLLKSVFDFILAKKFKLSPKMNSDEAALRDFKREHGKKIAKKGKNHMKKTWR